MKTIIRTAAVAAMVLGLGAAAQAQSRSDRAYEGFATGRSVHVDHAARTSPASVSGTVMGLSVPR